MKYVLEMLWSQSRMKLTDIKYPIFPIRSHDRIYEEDNILYVDTINKTWIVDNKNLNGITLAARRFKITDPYPLKPAIFTLAQLLRYKSSNNLYIDHLGKLFRHKKTNTYKLEYKKVLRYKVHEDQVAFFVKDVSYPIFVDYKTLNLYQDNDEELYLGLLWYNGSWIFYELSLNKKEDTWRKF